MVVVKPFPGASSPTDADAALEQLYATHWDPLVRLAWILTGDQSVADDLVADCFVALHRQWARLTDHGRAGAYLRRSVVNACRSAGRHRRVVTRENLRAAGSPDAPGRATAPSAESQALESVGHEELVALLRTLPRRQQEVLVLRYLVDLSEADIADALGISPGSVKAHAHRGLTTLRTTVTTREDR